MTDDATLLPWEYPGWLEEVRTWIETKLVTHNLKITAPLDPFHIRPWSAVVRVTTHLETIFFKASAPALSWEPALTGLLARSHPQMTPDLLALDRSRGWMLMRDSGTALRTSIRDEHSLQRWHGIMPFYAGLQKDLSSQVSTILQLGVPDRCLNTLPALLADMLQDTACLLIDQPEGLTSEEIVCLHEKFKVFERMCADLASAGIPATLVHDDFHDGNLFLQNNRVIFTDWGESTISHPFFSLVVMLRGAGNSLNLAEDAPELLEMRDWYLEQWSEFAPLADLRQISSLAEKIGLVNRALTWRHVIQHIPGALKPDYASAVPSYLQDFLTAIRSEA